MFVLGAQASSPVNKLEIRVMLGILESRRDACASRTEPIHPIETIQQYITCTVLFRVFPTFSQNLHISLAA